MSLKRSLRIPFTVMPLISTITFGDFLAIATVVAGALPRVVRQRQLIQLFPVFLRRNSTGVFARERFKSPRVSFICHPLLLSFWVRRSQWTQESKNKRSQPSVIMSKSVWCQAVGGWYSKQRARRLWENLCQIKGDFAFLWHVIISISNKYVFLLAYIETSECNLMYEMKKWRMSMLKARKICIHPFWGNLYHVYSNCHVMFSYNR